MIMVCLNIIAKPWAWYIAGPLIGLMVPLLLILGNKSFGISSSLRHFCAACVPAKIPFFSYDWKKEVWNLLFVFGIGIGGYIGFNLLTDSTAVVEVNSSLANSLSAVGIEPKALVPSALFSWQGLFTLRGFITMVVGGFLVGFGTRYAGGCTSGHSIMGLSSLQVGSLVATICFMAGGFFSAHFIVPFILNL